MSGPHNEPSLSKWLAPVIDREQGAELARQLAQQQLLTEALGGLWPELSSQELEGVEQILDLGCGPGSWALQVAYQHQDREIVGVDLSEAMVSYAIAQANVRHLENISFEVMDIRQSLEFRDQSFDLINGCLLSGVMTPSTWPNLLAECMRVLRPGGILRLTECETWISSSAAGMRLWRALCRALQTQGRSFSVDGSSLGIAPVLGKLLRDAGLVQVHQRAFTLDASAQEPLHVPGCKAIEMTFELLRPYLLQSSLLTEELCETQLRQLVIDMYRPDFASLAFGLTVWGRKPASERPEPVVATVRQHTEEQNLAPAGLLCSSRETGTQCVHASFSLLSGIAIETVAMSESRRCLSMKWRRAIPARKEVPGASAYNVPIIPGSYTLRVFHMTQHEQT